MGIAEVEVASFIYRHENGRMVVATFVYKCGNDRSSSDNRKYKTLSQFGFNVDSAL